MFACVLWSEGSIDPAKPAYSSQTCSKPSCGYVDKKNRPKQAEFVCRACGHKIHADVNAARNLEGAPPVLASQRRKASS